MSGVVGEAESCTAVSYLCDDWELCVTERCLTEDLGVDPTDDFEKLLKLPIIKALIDKRSKRTHDTRDVNQLRTGIKVWVLARGDRHRGGTVYDEKNQVVWLVAYGRHESGADNDFFPYCRGLDADRRLLPTQADYTRLFDDRTRRFVENVRVDAVRLTEEAAKNPGVEIRRVVGGRHGVSVAIEVDEGMRATTVAVKGTIVREHLLVLLTSIHTEATWDLILAMPGRPLDDDEAAWTYIELLDDE